MNTEMTRETIKGTDDPMRDLKDYLKSDAWNTLEFHRNAERADVVLILALIRARNPVIDSISAGILENILCYIAANPDMWEELSEYLLPWTITQDIVIMEAVYAMCEKDGVIL